LHTPIVSFIGNSRQ